MKNWAKTLLSISLICYIAVSSIAAVHAFPDLTKHPAPSNSVSHSIDMVKISDTSMSETTPDCHQQKADSSKNSSSVCKIFCAAMANVLSTEFMFDLASPRVNTEIVFLEKGFHTREFALEPHPPK